MALRRAARTDANKAAIVAALKEIGCSVYDLKQPVDLLVWSPWKDANILVEIKRPPGPKGGMSDRQHTPAQVRFILSWPGPVETVHSPAQAVAAMRPVDAPLETFADLVQTKCFCEACDVAQNGLRTRMHVCPQCGDKRCPKAENHWNQCRETFGDMVR